MKNVLHSGKPLPGSPVYIGMGHVSYERDHYNNVNKKMLVKATRESKNITV